MKISVIIPVYNRAATVQRAIQSVLQQQRPADEIIVIDDGSTDESAQKAASFPGVKVIRQQQQSGVSAARNQGILAASGDWIALLDSDDEWLPEKLARQSRHIGEQPGYRLCHCDEVWIRNGKRVNPANKHRKSGGWIYEHCLPLCAISPSASMLHRSVFDSIGLFDEQLPACEDYDYWLRLCATEPVLFIEQPLLNKYGGHDDQLSRRYSKMDRFRIYAMIKAIASGALNDSQLKATQAQLQLKLDILVNGARKRGQHASADIYQQRFARWARTPIPDEAVPSWHI